MKLVVGSSFWPLFDNASPYLVMVGGAGSGKSESAGRKIFYRAMKEIGARHRFLILRKVRNTLRESCVRVMLTILEENGVPYDYNKTDRVLTFHNTAGEPVVILFDGMDDREKIKSIKDITSIWLEESTEFSREDFMQIDLRLRGETKYYKQIILSFNPDEAQALWIKEDFFDKQKLGAFVHRSTIDDNPIAAVRAEYRAKLDAIGDEVYYKIYRLGEWALAKGIIFSWDVLPLPPDVRWDGIIYGLDFGYSVDPSAFVKVYRKADEYWLQELIYEPKLTNQELAARILQHPEFDAFRSIVYADSAEPKSIEELNRAGIIVKPAIKGPDSVRSGIDFMRSKRIHIVPGSTHIIDECRVYKFKETKDGRTLPEPVEYKNHAIDSARYAICTDYHEGGGDMEIVVL